MLWEIWKDTGDCVQNLLHLLGGVPLNLYMKSEHLETMKAREIPVRFARGERPKLYLQVQRAEDQIFVVHELPAMIRERWKKFPIINRIR